MIKYTFTVSGIGADKVLEVKDKQVDVIFLALSRLIEDYENIDAEYLSEDSWEALREANILTRNLGKLFL